MTRVIRLLLVEQMREWARCLSKNSFSYLKRVLLQHDFGVSDIIISDSNPITRLNRAPVKMSLFQIEEQNAAMEASFDLPCKRILILLLDEKVVS